MNTPLAHMRRVVLTALVAGGILCVVGLWWFETRAGLIFDLNRYGYPCLLLILSIDLVALIFYPSRWQNIVLGCYYGVAVYFAVIVAGYAVLQPANNIYALANTLQWMPAFYVVALVFFEKWKAIAAGVGYFAFSVLLLFAALMVTGPAVWDIRIGALLVNACLVHLFILAALSLFIVLQDQFEQVSGVARTMESVAHTDQLTGIANRHGLEMRLNGFGVSPEQPATVILLDMDHFKSVNDRFGHLVGDEVLRLVAQIMKSQLRSTDILGRWGGEEFLIVAPDTPLDAGMTLAERVRLAVRASVHPVAGPLSISAGVVVWTNRRHFIDALRLADRSLYEAKLRRVERSADA